LTVSKKESGYEMRFYQKDSLKSNMNMCEWGALFNDAYSIETTGSDGMIMDEFGRIWKEAILT
jgi:hypothetical protein